METTARASGCEVQTSSSSQISSTPGALPGLSLGQNLPSKMQQELLVLSDQLLEQGRQGQLQGHTYISSTTNSPHILQFGVCSHGNGIPEDISVAPLPVLIQILNFKSGSNNRVCDDSKGRMMIGC